MGRAVSATNIGLASYFKNKAGPRARFFDFNLIEDKPYTIPYFINFLAPGKYAIAKIEQSDIKYEQGFVSWYGGPEYRKTIYTTEDITLLDVPANVTWVTVDSGTSLVTLSSWSGVKQHLHPGENPKIKDFKIRVLSDGRISIYSEMFSKSCKIKVFTVNGQILGEFNNAFASNSTIIIPRKYGNKMLIFEFDNGNKLITKAFYCR